MELNLLKTRNPSEQRMDRDLALQDKKFEAGDKNLGKSDKIGETDRAYSEEDIIDMIERANEDFVAYDRKFEFSIHDMTKQITVKVIDTRTDEVIREIPPEKILDIIAGIWEAAGIIVDEKV